MNDIDSGFEGYWAYDDYRRLLRAWQSGPETYTLITQYNGQFDAVEGQESPAGDSVSTDVLSGDESGSMHGGYAGTIEGSLVEDPEWPTRGFVGTFDYEGDVQAGERPGAIDWTEIYFDGDFSVDWWGWIYRGGEYGTWVNAQSGSCGDVLDD